MKETDSETKPYRETHTKAENYRVFQKLDFCVIAKLTIILLE